MRAGSTLLKALLATRGDIVDSPEIHFNKISTKSIKVDLEKINVIKAPGYYTEYDYPILPTVADGKKIVLIRNPFDTVISLKKMNKITVPNKNSPLHNEFVLLSYWTMIYENVIQKSICTSSDSIVVKYENIVANPLTETERIFRFIDCKNTNGTVTYNKPDTYNWEWGRDDGGEIIKTLKVQKNNNKEENSQLKLLIESSKNVQAVLKYFDY
jgi:hypothetical protein